MNKILYTLAGCAIVFSSCSHDLDYKGEYDIKAYYSGTDPRENLLAFDKTQSEVFVPFIGKKCVSDKYEGELQIFSTRKVEDDAAFNVKIAGSDDKRFNLSSDYSLVAPENVQIEQGVIAKDTNAVAVKYSLEMNKIQPNSVVPFYVSLDNSSLTASKNRGVHALYIKSVQAINLSELTIDKDINIKSNGELQFLGDKVVSLNIPYTDLTGYTLQLNWDESILSNYPELQKTATLISKSAFPRVDPKVLTNENNVTVSFNIGESGHLEVNKTYVMPLRFKLLDKQGQEIPLMEKQGNLLVLFHTISISMVETNEAFDNPISKQGWTISTPTVGREPIENLINNDGDDYWYTNSYGDIDITVDMKKIHVLKGILIRSTPQYKIYTPKEYTVFTSENGTDWLKVSAIIDKSTRVSELKLKAVESINARYIKLRVQGTGGLCLLSEITIYGK